MGITKTEGTQIWQMGHSLVNSVLSHRSNKRYANFHENKYENLMEDIRQIKGKLSHLKTQYHKDINSL